MSWFWDSHAPKGKDRLDFFECPTCWAHVTKDDVMECTTCGKVICMVCSKVISSFLIDKYYCNDCHVKKQLERVGNNV